MHKRRMQLLNRAEVLILQLHLLASKMTLQDQANDVDLLIERENMRCQAMMAADIATLKDLLHPDLTHVHAKGQVDGYASYFSTGGFNVNYTRLERSDLKVQVMGDAALMTGRQMLVGVRKNGTGVVTIDSRVMQVWKRDEGQWRQLAFQTTPLEMSITQ